MGSRSNILQTGRFAGFSLIGILLFFLPVWNGVIPVVALINAVKAFFGENLEWVSIVSGLLLAAELIGWKVLKIPCFMKLFGEERMRVIFWICGILIILLRLFNSSLPIISDPRIGGKVLELGSTVFITIAIAGSLVVFIIKSGLVDFMAVLMEPVMKPVFGLPGEAAVNILSSFVSSASVGVFFTEQYYRAKRYTTRQACSVVTGFSVISVGYIGVIASLAGIGEMYGTLLVTSFFTVLLMGAIMIRIPPLSLLPDTCVDGSNLQGSIEDGNLKEPIAKRFRRAVEKGKLCAAGMNFREIGENTLRSLLFAQKIVGVMIPVVALVLTLVYYTPLFTWLGYPITPLLQLCRVPDAALAAPSVLIGIVEVSLPAILIGESTAQIQTRFFVSLLSIVQIIFFSEAGNAILASDIPLGAGKLIGIFLIRTAVAIPVVAFLSWLLCRM